LTESEIWDNYYDSMFCRNIGAMVMAAAVPDAERQFRMLFRQFRRVFRQFRMQNGSSGCQTAVLEGVPAVSEGVPAVPDAERQFRMPNDSLYKKRHAAGVGGLGGEAPQDNRK
jgi:hypothetical protein